MRAHKWLSSFGRFSCLVVLVSAFHILVVSSRQEAALRKVVIPRSSGPQAAVRVSAGSGMGDSQALNSRRALSGVSTFTTAAGVTLSSTSIDFRYQLVGTSSSLMDETITNAGAVPLVITNISISGHDRADFVASDTFALPVTISPGNSIAIGITFAPTLPWRAGTRNARMEISEKKNSQYVTLTGIGTTCGGPVPACESGCGDTDDDGLNDAWEIAGGIDLNNDGQIDSLNDVLLPGADSNRPDVYLHYDYTCASDHDHNPPLQAVRYIVDAFAAHGINLHIDPIHYALCERPGDTGCITVGTGAQVVTLGTPGTGITDPSCAGPSAVSMHELRGGIPYLKLIKVAYHYMVFAHYASIPTAGGPWICPNDPENPACGSNVSQPPAPGNLGTAEIGGDDAIVATQPFVDSGAVLDVRSIPLEWWSGLAMHELGHNLGLLHGGSDCFNNKPNYLGVMNYRFYLGGIPVAASPGEVIPKSCNSDAECSASDHAVGAHCSSFTNTCFRIDYSDRLFNSLDESGDLDETLGLQGGLKNMDISWRCTGTTPQFSHVATNGSPVDWNNDGLIETSIAREVNCDSQNELLLGQNDWENNVYFGRIVFSHLHFKFQCDPNFGD